MLTNLQKIPNTSGLVFVKSLPLHVVEAESFNIFKTRLKYFLNLYICKLYVIMKLVLVFNFWKRYRVTLVFPFHDVFLLFIFFIVNKLCLFVLIMPFDSQPNGMRTCPLEGCQVFKPLLTS